MSKQERILFRQFHIFTRNDFSSKRNFAQSFTGRNFSSAFWSLFLASSWASVDQQKESKFSSRCVLQSSKLWAGRNSNVWRAVISFTCVQRGGTGSSQPLQRARSHPLSLSFFYAYVYWTCGHTNKSLHGWIAFSHVLTDALSACNQLWRGTEDVLEHGLPFLDGRNHYDRTKIGYGYTIF